SEFRVACYQSPVPVCAALPLYRDARWIEDFDPDRAPPRSIGAVDPFRDDSLGAKPAGVLEHNRAILGNVFVGQDASPAIAQQSRERRLAVEEREIAQILAVMLDQVKRVEDRSTRGLAAADSEALRPDPLGGNYDRRQSSGPIVGMTAVESHCGAVP